MQIKGFFCFVFFPSLKKDRDLATKSSSSGWALITKTSNQTISSFKKKNDTSSPVTPQFRQTQRRAQPSQEDHLRFLKSPGSHGPVTQATCDSLSLLPPTTSWTVDSGEIGWPPGHSWLCQTPAEDEHDRLKVWVVACREWGKSLREQLEELHHIVSRATFWAWPPVLKPGCVSAIGPQPAYLFVPRSSAKWR